ncbi:PAPS_reductase domain-containing protein [Aliarcobacter cibarius]|uniref:phosphoadenosine phosphosulfate reductase domain-containing protein n=1 Tax=Aliarcobacter cibarius TaxID=255507 RepID=UPI0012466DEF|nr:phosphoadenosine phosphosulfate reductase family protein [Aliarcobacter cibarius]QEZ89070.1 PAPS_reductase domain-containing protein [Aliarcobacter cibarius]
MKQSKILKKLLNTTTITEKTIFVISISGGKDSKATLIVSLPLLLRYVKSHQIKVIFCDTNWEKDSTYNEINLIINKLKDFNIELLILRNEKFPNGMLDLIKYKKSFPTRMIKFCTEQLKMIPALDYYKNLYLNGFDVICLVGKRRDESKDRIDTPDSKLYEYKDYSFLTIHPIADWTETDVYSLLDETWGIPLSYFDGNKRVGCDECFQADLKSISLMSENRINQMEELENYLLQFYKDRKYYPTFFFRKNKTFPEGFAPIREIVNYAKDKYNFNYFTFHTRALQFLRDKLGQKALRYKFVQFGYVPDKTNFSKYVNGLLPVPQKMQFDVEYLTSKFLNSKERLELLTFQKLEYLEKEENSTKCDCESYNLL